MRDSIALVKRLEGEFAAEEAWKNRPRDPATPHLSLERRSEGFRKGLARKHLDRVREERAAYRKALDVWAFERMHDDNPDGELYYDPSCPDGAVEALRDAVATIKWHENRAKGQVQRFERVRTCGETSIVASCAHCKHETKLMPELCGVRRVCVRCDTAGAMKRRARFGRGRGRIFVEGHRQGLTRKRRAGGRYTEKMLTLTIPHVRLEELRAGTKDKVRETAHDDVHARILALHKAWPRFNRKLGRYWKERGERWVSYHRAFEWTPGDDRKGHPHFHVYLWCPFVDRDVVRELWAEALQEVGVRVRRSDEGRAVLSVDLRMLYTPNVHMVRELLKGGRRSALTLSKIESVEAHSDQLQLPGVQRWSVRGGGGLDAFDYSEGWTINDVRARIDDETEFRLYRALEGRRLQQASRGFFADDPPPCCPCCHGEEFRVRREPRPPQVTIPSSSPAESRGPP